MREISKRSAFSMIELVFVIVILGVLAAVAVPRFVATRNDAQVATIRSDIASVMKAIVAKVFADNIDATQPKAPNPNKAVAKQTSAEYIIWGDWMIEVGGLDRKRWVVGGGDSNGIIAQMAGRFDAQSAIQPVGDVKDRYGSYKKDGCSAIIVVIDGYLHFAPNNIGNNAKHGVEGNRGAMCNALKASYASSMGGGNKSIPLAITGTVEF